MGLTRMSMKQHQLTKESSSEKLPSVTEEPRAQLTKGRNLEDHPTQAWDTLAGLTGGPDTWVPPGLLVPGPPPTLGPRGRMLFLRRAFVVLLGLRKEYLQASPTSAPGTQSISRTCSNAARSGVRGGAESGLSRDSRLATSTQED